jgi:integrase
VAVFVFRYPARVGRLGVPPLLNHYPILTFAEHQTVKNEIKVRRSDPEKPVIIPFTEQDIKLMLKACERSRPYVRRHQRVKSSHALPSARRNKAIILTLLDTGLRASELCSIKMVDVDFKNKQIKVNGKGDKEQTLEISGRTAQLIWRYLATRSSEPLDNEPLFIGDNDLCITRGGLLQMTKRTGKGVGVTNANPHRFKHTFAINFLRNGGNIYALKELLGHSTLDMVKHYLELSEQDCAAVHRLASPVANWGL